MSDDAGWVIFNKHEGYPLPLTPILEDYLKFSLMPHVSRISWDAIGIPDLLAAETARQRAEWDKQIPAQELQGRGPLNKQDHKKQIRSAVLKAISEHRPDVL